MPCLLGLMAFFTPRIVLVLVWLFGSGYLGRAYETWLWPVLGFFFMPLTTLAYAYSINTNSSVDGLYLVLVVIAVLIDLGMIGGGEKARRRRKLKP